jgi:hypothetical protein
MHAYSCLCVRSFTTASQCGALAHTLEYIHNKSTQPPAERVVVLGVSKTLRYCCAAVAVACPATAVSLAHLNTVLHSQPQRVRAAPPKVADVCARLIHTARTPVTHRPRRPSARSCVTLFAAHLLHVFCCTVCRPECVLVFHIDSHHLYTSACIHACGIGNQWDMGSKSSCFKHPSPRSRSCGTRLQLCTQCVG